MTMTRSNQMDPFTPSLRSHNLQPMLSLIQQNAALFALDTGGVNACIVTLSPPLSTYSVGQVVHFKVANTNTGAATLNINNLGAKSLNKNGQALVAGDLTSGDMVTVSYDGAAFQVQSAMRTPIVTDNAISGDKIHGGTISDFTSVGIDDNATSTILTLDSDNSMTLKVDDTGTITIKKKFTSAHQTGNRGSKIGLGLVDGGGISGMYVQNVVSTNPVYNSQEIYFQVSEGGVTSARVVGRLDQQGNWIVGDAVAASNSQGNFHLCNGTPPSSSMTDGVILYAENVAASSELKVRDEAGNVTTLSPHNFTLFQPDIREPIPWSYYSRNTFLGKEINVDMAAVVRAVEELTGKTFIHVRDLPESERQQWQDAQQQRIIAARSKVMETLMSQEVMISQQEALVQAPQWVPVEVSQPIYAIAPDSGQVVMGDQKVNRLMPVGELVWQVRPGVRFDERSGQFFRLRTKEEAEAMVDGAEEKQTQPPTWLQNRGVGN